MQADRTEELLSLLAERILVLDGGTGTMIQEYKLSEREYRGEVLTDDYTPHPRDIKGNNELLVITRRVIIVEIPRGYLDAGADIIETNTFIATRVSQAEYGQEDVAWDIDIAGARS